MGTLRDDLVANLEHTLAMPVDQLAQRLLVEIPRHIQNGLFHPDAVVTAVTDAPFHFEPGIRLNLPQQKQLENALRRAFQWLETNALIVSAGGFNATFRVLTDEGRALASKPAFDQFKAAQDFRADTLHQSLRGTVYSAAVRGEFDNAIAQAFKLLEVQVRAASGVAGLVGVPLMRSAFQPNTGPLADKSRDGGEQQGVSDLFAGAFGSYRNPSSHREVTYSGIVEVQRILMLVSLLMETVEARCVSPT